MENTNPNMTSGKHISFWLDSEQPLKFERLNADLETDILIIGGGIAGLTTAYLLLKSGRKVTLVEDGFLGSGETGRTTAHLSSALDDRYYYIADIFDDETAKLAAESHTAAINMIATIVRDENIDCCLKTVEGYLFLDPSDKDDSLQKEFEATRNAGLKTSLQNSTPGISGGKRMSSLRFDGQAQFHVIKYLKGLSDAVASLGGKIFTETKAEKIDTNGAVANGYQVKANHIIVATNSPVNDIVTMHTKQAPYRTYVVAGLVKKGSLPYALWWDTGNMDSRWVSEPYHYVRLEEYSDEYDLLISGGEDHKTGQADEENIPEQDRYAILEQWTRKHFPMMENVEYRWSGQVMEPVDALGFLGRNPGDENVYIITGDSGNGMTHTTIGAMIINDLITGRSNPWEKIYDPARITLNTAGDFMKETGNMAAQYLDYLTPEDLKHVEALGSDHGGIITSGLTKTAVYRDTENQLHAFSAVCPHLGCIVQWNDDEKSFDCPCHGSRFDCKGKVMNGPAKSDLHPVHHGSKKF